MTTLNVPDQHIFWRGDESTHERSRECQCGPRLVYAEMRPYVAHRNVAPGPMSVFPAAKKLRRISERRMHRYVRSRWLMAWLYDRVFVKPYGVRRAC